MVDRTVSAIILNEDGAVWTQHHVKLNKLTPVSGKAEDNEDPEEAILREIHEEVGLTPNQVELNGYVRVFQPVTGKLEFMFDVKVLSGEMTNCEPEKHYWQGYRSLVELEELSKTIPYSESMLTALKLYKTIK